MAARDRTTLKGIWITGYTPTQANYIDFFDSYLNITDDDTDSLTEGATNLFYTQGRFDTAFTAKDTDDLSEGGTNLYYTDARVNANASVSANTAKVTNATHTGDVTGSTALTIASNAVTSDKIADGAVTPDKIDTAIQSLSDGATVTLDADSSLNGAVTITANRTLAVSNIAAGQTVLIKVTQGGAGGFSFTSFPSNSNYLGGALTWSSGAGDIDILCGWYDGTNWFWNIGTYS